MDGYMCSDPMARQLEPGVDIGLPGPALILFIISKLPELADTIFLILKNKRVERIHWYHHFSVMLFCWHALATEYAPGMVVSDPPLT